MCYLMDKRTGVNLLLVCGETQQHLQLITKDPFRLKCSFFSPSQSFAVGQSLVVRCKHGPPHLFEQLSKFGNPHE